MIDTWPAIRPETNQLRTEAVIEYLPIRLSTGHPNGHQRRSKHPGSLCTVVHSMVEQGPPGDLSTTVWPGRVTQPQRQGGLRKLPSSFRNVSRRSPEARTALAGQRSGCRGPLAWVLVGKKKAPLSHCRKCRAGKRR